ncbi:hypothetical protein [Paraburkholderia tagetis]|uniref:Uncharacterized protein n=1 Tax=Paraburkholderia tagetis TaxID=2913261 RepID=A0A9X1UJ03_9BURK|nr:hypothetical protein [Paraburkholderia tagetis]MCG5076223.1 hypothetical protein [Paraburkholderia tagetis]
MLDLFDENPEPAPEAEAEGVAQGSRATSARRAARTKAAGPAEDAASAGGDADDKVAASAHAETLELPVAREIDASESNVADASGPTDEKAGAQASGMAATEARKQPEPQAEPLPGLHDVAKEPVAVPLSASGHTYAPTSATGNAAHMISAVHAVDVDPAVHGLVPERAASLGAERAATALPSEIVAAMAAQTRRTQWMLTAAVAALVVTAGVAIAQTVLLASLSADAQAQQQRFDVLMQNQQAALDSVAARLAAPAAAVPVAAAMAAVPATAAASAAREPESATPPRHAARTAKATKSTEKSASHAAGSKSAKARSQHASRQAAAKN